MNYAVINQNVPKMKYKSESSYSPFQLEHNFHEKPFLEQGRLSKNLYLLTYIYLNYTLHYASNALNNLV